MQTFENHFEKIHPCTLLEDRNLLLFDIETTGLSYERALLYMISCGYYDNNSFQMITFFNDDGISEEELLHRFQSLIETRKAASDKPLCMVSFNGLTFDVPFLNRHFIYNEMTCDLYEHDMLDLFKELKCCKNALGMDKCRQVDFEDLLGIERICDKNGKELIGIYKKYLKKKDEALREELLRHNIYDVINMEALLPLLYLKYLPDQIDTVLATNVTADRLAVKMSMKNDIGYQLALYSDLSEDIQTNIDGRQITLCLPICNNRIKIYYENPKDYYYLPSEDRAIHKSVGAFVDREHRIRAKRETCYDRIAPERLAGLPESAMLPLLLSQMKCIFHL